MTAEMPEKVLPLGVEHLGKCAEVFVAAFSEEPWNQPWTLEAARERLAEILDTPNSLGLACLSGTARSWGSSWASPGGGPMAGRSSWTICA